MRVGDKSERLKKRISPHYIKYVLCFEIELLVPCQAGKNDICCCRINSVIQDLKHIVPVGFLSTITY